MHLFAEIIPLGFYKTRKKKQIKGSHPRVNAKVQKLT